MGFQEDVHGSSIGFLWHFHDVSMIFLEDFYGISMVFLRWCFYDISVGFYWIPVGSSIPMMFLWCFYGITMQTLMVPMLFHVISKMFYGISVGSYGISMIFLWSFYGITMGCQLKVSCWE
jgi:hypothetical protein